MSPLALAGDHWPERGDPWSYRVAMAVLTDTDADLARQDVAFLHVAAATAIEGSLSPKQTERLTRLAARCEGIEL